MYLIYFLLLPPTINLILGILGLLLIKRWHLCGVFCILLAFLSLWLFSTPFFASFLINSLQNQYPPFDVRALKTLPSAIVVLGGGNYLSPPEYGYVDTIGDVTLARLRYAIYLHEKTGLPILVSGKSGRNQPGSPYTEATKMAEVALHDFKVSIPWREEHSTNTAEEGIWTAAFLKNRRHLPVILVTNAWHMPRAVYSFNRAGLKVIPAPMGYFARTKGISSPDIPSAAALNVSVTALHEYIGLLWYYFNYPGK
jgi:uncharacterized SAM-binding protein YcdF (DUF218 family)